MYVGRELCSAIDKCVVNIIKENLDDMGKCNSI